MRLQTILILGETSLLFTNYNITYIGPFVLKIHQISRTRLHETQVIKELLRACSKEITQGESSTLLRWRFWEDIILHMQYGQANLFSNCLNCFTLNWSSRCISHIENIHGSGTSCCNLSTDNWEAILSKYASYIR